MDAIKYNWYANAQSDVWYYSHNNAHTHSNTYTHRHTHTHMRAWEILENYNMQSDLCDLGLLLGIQNKIAEQIYRSTVHIWCATRSTEK